MHCIALVAKIIDEPSVLPGHNAAIVVCRIRPLDSPDVNWVIETPLDDNSVLLLEIGPGATVFVCGRFVVETRKRGDVQWPELSVSVDRLDVIDRGPKPERPASKA